MPWHVLGVGPREVTGREDLAFLNGTWALPDEAPGFWFPSDPALAVEGIVGWALSFYLFISVPFPHLKDLFY